MSADERGGASGFSAEPLRVLVADDEAMARRRLLRLLEAMPDVRLAGECADGDEVLERVRGGGVDVVLLDIQMPGLTGLDALALLPAEGPVVVFCTAYAEHAVAADDAQGGQLARAGEAHAVVRLVRHQPLLRQPLHHRRHRRRRQPELLGDARRGHGLVALLLELPDRLEVVLDDGGVGRGVGHARSGAGLATIYSRATPQRIPTSSRRPCVGP